MARGVIRTVLWRLTWFALALFVFSLVTFIVLDSLPGDPARTILGMNATDTALSALHARLGLDRPWFIRYLAWVGDLLHGQFGTSMTYDVPVAELLSGRLAITLPLALMAMFIAVSIGLPLGTFAAARQHTADGLAVDALAQLGQAVPDFWLGMALVVVFALHWHLAPSGGFPGWGAPWAALDALLLPAVALALPQAAVLTRVLRSALISTNSADFVRAAQAKGIGPVRIFLTHALPNALVPALTISTMQFSFLLGGAVVVETVFDLPGIGRMLFDAVSNHDLVVLRDLVMLIAATIGSVSMLAELAADWLDPRARRAAPGEPAR